MRRMNTRPVKAAITAKNNDTTGSEYVRPAYGKLVPEQDSSLMLP